MLRLFKARKIGSVCLNQQIFFVVVVFMLGDNQSAHQQHNLTLRFCVHVLTRPIEAGDKPIDRAVKICTETHFDLLATFNEPVYC